MLLNALGIVEDLNTEDQHTCLARKKVPYSFENDPSGETVETQKKFVSMENQ